MENETENRSRLRRVFETMRGHGFVPRGGERAIGISYWHEKLNRDPGARIGRGRNTVIYKDEAERRSHLVRFQNNLLDINLRNRFTIGITGSTSGEIIYVVDQHRNFYVGRKNIDHFHHSTFLSGAPVLAAGTMVIEPGLVILEVNNHSGHYKPGLEQLKLAAFVMKLKGADLNKISFKYSPPTGEATRWNSGFDMLKA